MTRGLSFGAERGRAIGMRSEVTGATPPADAAAAEADTISAEVRALAQPPVTALDAANAADEGRHAVARALAAPYARQRSNPRVSSHAADQ